ncbi:hypothetical protein [Photorhabdus luminescens]|uniref:Uncharacterized protein n=1 Tax=Photorhabdus luminescens subsp. mexicana TaxID=2100167 RepID=A0A4R4JKD4_PHOLU|nr:hypothetical protein [Photorhabdus luminescens]TDB54376.1 hypothetical protein C5468_04195 [Photorhabdus luminescens subsp. mexicana]
MNNRDTLFPIIKDDITFDTLLTQAKTVIEQQSGQHWNDTGENDPGITLLEACCYGASDLAYRHSLPLKDLLTPKQKEQTPGDGIFPKEFGPQQILTCGPITEEDYRRALLDLHSNDKRDGYFLFNDVQLIREPEDQRYTYWYNKQERQYSFTKDEYRDTQQLKLTLRGNYWLYLLPSRETQANNTLAQTKLKTFLEDNRNLGESVSKIIWLKPTDISLKIDIQLNDDVKDIADIFAKIYTTAEQMVLEKPLCYTTQAMKEMGYSNEEIFDGPYLRHGWLPKLPSIKDYTEPKELNLSPLVNQLLRIKGIKSITKFTLDEHNQEKNDNWSWTIEKEHYPRLWGNNPLQLITSPDSPLTITAKGGIKVTISKQDIENKIIPEPLINTQPELVNWGKHRKVLDYYPVSNKLPACYELQTNIQQQIQLHQFMLPFEQMLANNCAELALLPKLLAFKQRGNTVHGTQWPFKENSVGQNVHQNIKPNLINQINNRAKIENNDKSYAKELVIIDYLLRYFGAQCSIPLLQTNSQQFLALKEDFLSTQREYLAQQPNLAYQRNNIRIDQVSALQKRIAARLGLGGECFSENPELDKLPFYLIEHRQLLPVKSAHEYNNKHTPNNIEVRDKQLIITQTGSEGKLLRGQVINLITNESYGDFLLLNQMITEVTGNIFTLNINNSRVLQENLKKVQLAFNEGKLSWKNSPEWMEDMDYQLVYADHPPSREAENERWITVSDKSHFPAMIRENDEITLNIKKTHYEIKAQIAKYDDNGKKILLKKNQNSENNFPSKGEASLYNWNFDLNGQEIKYNPTYDDDDNEASNEAKDELWITVNDQQLFDNFIINNEIILNANAKKDYEIKTHVKKFDPIKRQILLEKESISKNNFPKEEIESFYYWYFSGERYTQADHFSFVVSVVLNRKLIESDKVDPYKIESWVKAEILAELPAHISLVIHWLSPEHFNDFANKYKFWQNSAAPLGDTAYEILKTLTLGKPPSTSSEEELRMPDPV